jgi:hypothetical protein
MAFHSSLHVFKRLCAPAGAAESAAAAQTAAAQRAASPDFMMTSPLDKSFGIRRASDKPIAPPSQAKVVYD